MNANELVGKIVLVGLTYLDEDGQILNRMQLSGTFVWADEEMVRIECSNGEEFTLPPDLDAFTPAKPGKYTLKGTGEVVENPDYLVSWTIHPGET
jgi:hypothetical protein